MRRRDRVTLALALTDEMWAIIHDACQEANAVGIRHRSRSIARLIAEKLPGLP